MNLRFLLGFLTIFLISFEPIHGFICYCFSTSCTFLYATDANIFHNVHQVCPLANAKSIQSLALFRYGIDSLPDTFFTIFPSVHTLEIHYSQALNMNKLNFANATELQILSLKQSHVTLLKENQFLGAENLTELIITSNTLNEIDERAFANLPKLEKLFLANNFLDQLPENVFVNLTTLKILNLASNNLTTLSGKLFENLKNLEYFDVSNNNMLKFDMTLLSTQILNVRSNHLQELYINDNIKEIDAAYNQIERVIVNTGKILTRLKLLHNNVTDTRNITKIASLMNLNLSGNRLNSNTTFENMTQLEDLTLHGTYIKWKPGMFKNVDLLKRLDLSQNNLTEIDYDALEPLKLLEVLSVSGNYIRKIHYHKIHELLPKLRILEICSNNWNQTYFLQNIEQMKKFNLKPDLLNFHDLFKDHIVEFCAISDNEHDEERESEDYHSEEIYTDTYSDEVMNISMNSTEKVEESIMTTETVSNTEIVVTTTMESTTSTVGTTTSSVKPIDNQTIKHHIEEHDFYIVEKEQETGHHNQRSHLWIYITVCVVLIALSSIATLVYFKGCRLRNRITFDTIRLI
uniref:Putative leucine-rich repeat-containing g-protein coupled receptor 5 n=1 Tax=Corethrella appendiculata TaxID=1370023 RepID=U5EQ53_9DIPT